MRAAAVRWPAGTNAAVLMKLAHVTSGVVRLLFVIVTAQPPLPAARPTTPRLFPVVTQKLTAPAVGGVVHAMVVLYLTESAKYASSAVTRFRRSDFMEAMYAFAFVLANFGIAMAAKMPMITTTISSSMSVKPLRFILAYPPVGERWAQEQHSGEPSGSPRSEVTLATRHMPSACSSKGLVTV